MIYHNINIIDTGSNESFYPITCTRKLKDCLVGGTTLENAIINKVTTTLEKANVSSCKTKYLNIRTDFWPSSYQILELIHDSKRAVYAKNLDGIEVCYMWISEMNKTTDFNSDYVKRYVDESSLILQYPWDLLQVNEEIINNIEKGINNGRISDKATIEGNIILGEGSVILPGVYIEGNVIFGKNCKIGPNCYIRGASYFGDNSHIGQAVEIKNSILMGKVSIGHISYIGDSIIGDKTNFGAGTISANFRHDGKNHRSVINGEIIDTGLRKLGTIIGDGVHTGIHTSIYPGRKIWPHVSTLPGEIVKKDKETNE